MSQKDKLTKYIQLFEVNSQTKRLPETPLIWHKSTASASFFFTNFVLLMYS